MLRKSLMFGDQAFPGTVSFLFYISEKLSYLFQVTGHEGASNTCQFPLQPEKDL